MATSSEKSTVAKANEGTRFRIVLAGLFHETHTFLEGLTTWNAFDVREGVDLFQARGDASPLGGILEFAQQQNWDVIPTVMATAVPSATVHDEVLDRYWERWIDLASDPIAAGVDAIFLVLHGAFVSESYRDGEGELLRRIRAMPGASTVPIFGVYDLHANYSNAMATLSDCLVAYRENPHWDARDSAVRAGALLQRSLLEGVRPRQFMAQSPIIWPPTGTASASPPMHGLLQLARRLELEHPEFWVVNVNAGFAFADSPDTGVSFSIATTGDEATARVALRSLVDLAVQHAAEGNVLETPLDELLMELRDLAQLGKLSGLTVLAEPSDNIGAGAPGDGTGLLRGLLKYDIRNAAVCLCDASSVKLLENMSIGDSITLKLGHGNQWNKESLELDCELLRLCEGTFELEDKQSHLASLCGDRFDMGRCAVVRHAGVTILLTSRRTPPMDLGQWRHVGIDPEKLSVIGVKAAVAHRKAYDPIASRHEWVETQGPCQSRLTAFAFQHVRRPIYPLDPLEQCRLSLREMHRRLRVARP